MNWYTSTAHKLLDELQPHELGARRALERLAENPGQRVALMLINRGFTAVVYTGPSVLRGTVAGIYDERATYAMIVDDAEAALAELRKLAGGVPA